MKSTGNKSVITAVVEECADDLMEGHDYLKLDLKAERDFPSSEFFFLKGGNAIK